MFRSSKDCLRSIIVAFFDTSLQFVCWVAVLVQIPFVPFLLSIVLLYRIVEGFIAIVFACALLPFILPALVLEIIRVEVSTRLGFPEGYPPDLPTWSRWRSRSI